ncbi:MAG: putative sulfate exporter family transporter, partial [Pusillimonas sp.]
DFATMVKLTRTLSIIPTVLIFAYLNTRLKQKQNLQGATSAKVNFFSLFPWFIAAFVALAVVNSLGLIPHNVSLVAKDTSKFLMVAALGAIGLNTDFKDLKKLGLAPMLHGFIVSVLVLVVALAVIMF